MVFVVVYLVHLALVEYQDGNGIMDDAGSYLSFALVVASYFFVAYFINAEFVIHLMFMLVF
jgi:hypothetical protein